MLFGFMKRDLTFWVARLAHNRGSDLADVGWIGVASIICRSKYKLWDCRNRDISILNLGKVGELSEKFCLCSTSWGCWRGGLRILLWKSHV